MIDGGREGIFGCMDAGIETRKKERRNKCYREG